ncbi:Bifunctional NAD(P)H-hydrate repair enzyme Nnr [Propionispora sp. 2/2-37]|uniref:NAD(P)H-hydrate dehydratase n=1 Tax=Propionispora sp. 2/2-37 TaxID=1677858 RepID=UPI0006BB6748|nr:NAD(P)H-hydrate dehydratase [Propionispora sp. 2/2-37]CUH96282.1 Bifunctional NAD(P)H-hydrate repair enzyme Nnr [Propionispora sp. 2/2-37]
MKAATAEQMRKIDNLAMDQYKIPGIVLMENAGKALAEAIEAALYGVNEKKVCIFAGKGNNGGDGFVAARHLSNRGAKIKVFLFCPKDQISGDAALNLQVLLRMGVDIVEVTGIRDWDKVKIGISFADCLVDALLGTGFKGEITGNMAQVIDLINLAGKIVVAADIPSGVHADNGQVGKTAVRARHTVTFGLYKPGLLFHPGCEYAGRITLADIGIPGMLLVDPEIKQNMVTQQEVTDTLKPRHPAAHKGICGHVLAVAGSPGLTGAAVLCSEAAMRAGAGLVTLGIAAGLNDVLAIKLTEVMTKALPEHTDGVLGNEAWETISLLSARCQVLAVGPGLGRHEATQALVETIIKQAQCPLVLDADALFAISGNTGVLAEAQALPVLTPHPGEMARLTGLSISDINENKTDIARMAAAEWQAIVVLKGAPTVTAFPDGEIFINTTGNAGMATAGSGDVLTGVIAGLVAQGLSSHDAAVSGVYVHGLAGDIAAQRGITGMMAADIVRALPEAIYRIQHSKSNGGKLF